MASKKENGWSGKTIYRNCSCGETAFDAIYEYSVSVVGRFVYKCRNCNKLASRRG